MFKLDGKVALITGGTCTGQCIQIDGGITGSIPIAADCRDYLGGLAAPTLSGG